MSQKSPERDEGKLRSKDITPILKGWDYEPGTINVRKIAGADGLPKLQMRVDLGLLQMELTGRPDGQRPHGYESLLEYHEERLNEYRQHHGGEEGFRLNSEECQSLRDEAFMYYQRYLSLFVLEDFPGVVRDTGRNLRALDLCAQYGADEQDRLILEQYRPYITMMNTRASASILYNERQYPQAIDAIQQGLDRIREFFARFGQEDVFDESNEVKVLKRFAREIRRKLPIDPMQRLQARLQRALKAERYEEAAKLRDEIAVRRNGQGA